MEILIFPSIQITHIYFTTGGYHLHVCMYVYMYKYTFDNYVAVGVGGVGPRHEWIREIYSVT